MTCTDENFQKLLYGIESSEIKNYNFDIKTNKISFIIEYKEYEDIEQHSISIEEVSTFYTFEDTKSMEIPWEDDSFLELTSICLDNAYINILGSKRGWLEQYNSSINICIEIWDRILLIKGERIIIDNKIINLS